MSRHVSGELFLNGSFSICDDSNMDEEEKGEGWMEGGGMLFTSAFSIQPYWGIEKSRITERREIKEEMKEQLCWSIVSYGGDAVAFWGMLALSAASAPLQRHIHKNNSIDITKKCMLWVCGGRIAAAAEQSVTKSTAISGHRDSKLHLCLCPFWLMNLGPCFIGATAG